MSLLCIHDVMISAIVTLDSLQYNTIQYTVPPLSSPITAGQCHHLLYWLSSVCQATIEICIISRDTFKFPQTLLLRVKFIWSPLILTPSARRGALCWPCRAAAFPQSHESLDGSCRTDLQRARSPSQQALVRLQKCLCNLTSWDLSDRDWTQWRKLGMVLV